VLVHPDVDLAVRAGERDGRPAVGVNKVGEARVDHRVTDAAPCPEVVRRALDRCPAGRIDASSVGRYVSAGTTSSDSSTKSAPAVTYGWKPAPNGAAVAPTFVAVVVTVSPDDESS
jgi:hypothetical protein